MRDLLRSMPDGVPDDCLLARIKGRRAFLIRDWDRLMQLPVPHDGIGAAPWRAGIRPGGEGWEHRALQQEYARIFSWLREPLRRALALYFWLAEVRTVGIALRMRAGGGTIGRETLQATLLCKPLCRILMAPGSVAELAERLTVVLVTHAPAFAALPEVYRNGGTAALESALNSISLQCRPKPEHPALQQGIALLIDGMNLTMAAKALRWNTARPLPLLPGGTVRPASLQALADRGWRAGLARMAAGLGGQGREGDPHELERTVVEAQKRALVRLAREPSGLGSVIDYLWRCRFEATAIGLLSRVGIAGVDWVAAEIGQ